MHGIGPHLTHPQRQRPLPGSEQPVPVAMDQPETLAVGDRKTNELPWPGAAVPKLLAGERSALLEVPVQLSVRRSRTSSTGWTTLLGRCAEEGPERAFRRSWRALLADEAPGAGGDHRSRSARAASTRVSTFERTGGPSLSSLAIAESEQSAIWASCCLVSPSASRRALTDKGARHTVKESMSTGYRT